LTSTSPVVPHIDPDFKEKAFRAIVNQNLFYNKRDGDDIEVVQEEDPTPLIAQIKEFLNVKAPILDKGFVRVIDYLGSDKFIAHSARVSYADGTKKINSDAGLIDYLLRNHHTSPFEQC